MRRAALAVLGVLFAACGVAWVVMVAFYPGGVRAFFRLLEAGTTAAARLGPFGPIARLPFAVLFGVTAAPLLGGMTGAAATGALAVGIGYGLWRMRDGN